jgi:hypothetical protein
LRIVETNASENAGRSPTLFTVDGTLIEAWASQKSFHRSDEKQEPQKFEQRDHALPPRTLASPRQPSTSAAWVIRQLDTADRPGSSQ